MMFHLYLTFSDGAKYADIARSIVQGNEFSSSFNFWGANNAQVIQPGMPLAIAGFFKIFGISDLSVIATSSFFYLLLVLTTYLLGKKLFGELVGLLSAIAMAANINFLEYAASGASETLFAFEIILGAYFLILRKRWADILGFITLMAMYFPKPQAFIYIAGL